jgi:hypothetical protein
MRLSQVGEFFFDFVNHIVEPQNVFDGKPAGLDRRPFTAVLLAQDPRTDLQLGFSVAIAVDGDQEAGFLAFP